MANKIQHIKWNPSEEELIDKINKDVDRVNISIYAEDNTHIEELARIFYEIHEEVDIELWIIDEYQ